MNWTETIESYLSRGLGVSGGKGDNAAAQAQKQANDLQKQALDMQKQQIASVNSAVQQFVNGQGQGFDPALLKTLTSQMLDQNAASFNDASKTLQGMLTARGEGGGNLPTGGQFIRSNSTLLGQQAASQTSGLENINIANLQQMLSNRFNAASIMAGIPATLNGPIGSLGAQSSAALGGYLSAVNNPNSFTNVFGNILGRGAATGVIGGIGSMLNGGTFGTGIKAALGL